MDDAHEIAVGQAIATEFYNAVPRHFETFCPVASRVALEVFRRFDIAGNLAPCQLWHASSSSCHVLGFVGSARDDRWDGHVVCTTQTLVIDAAVKGIHRDFGLEVPAVALTRRLTAPSQMIACGRGFGDNKLWWLNAPYGFDTTVPLQPVELINDLASELTARVQQALAANPSPARSAA